MTKVLIVDDDEMVRLTVRTMLQHAGYQVEEASDGNEGLRALQQNEYDLIITDIIMPDCEGIEFIRGALEGHPNRRIVAMSGGGRIRNTEFLDLAKKCGAKAVLPKPFEPDELMSVIGIALR